MDNLYTIEVHKNSLIIEPSFTLPDVLARITTRLEARTCSSAQYFELGDCDGKHPYTEALDQIDRSIGQLKRFRYEMQQLASHAHRWNEDDYCSICGADGRA